MSRTLWIGGTVVVLLVLVCAGYWFFWKKVMVPQENMLTYSDAKYGISFQYPDTYELMKGEVGNAERAHYAIILTRREDLPAPENGEGPPTISFDLYQNDLDKISLVDWVKGVNDSNFKLSNGAYTSTTVSGAPAVRYSWDGLYRGDAVVFLHKERIVMVTGMYLEETDPIRGDFERVIDSISLY